MAKSMDEGKEVARRLRGWMDGGQEFIGGQQVEWGEGFTETERLLEVTWRPRVLERKICKN